MSAVEKTGEEGRCCVEVEDMMKMHQSIAIGEERGHSRISFEIVNFFGNVLVSGKKLKPSQPL